MMKRAILGYRARLLVAGLACLGLSTLPVHQAHAKGDDVAPEDIRISTFSGAFLAGQSAENNLDLDAATTFYSQALKLDPENLSVVQALFLNLLSNGQVDEAVPHAEKLRDTPDINRVARLALAVASIKARQFSDAHTVAELPNASDLDRLIFSLVRAWADAGAGKKDKAIDDIRSLEGPDWFSPFRMVNAAMIAEAYGDRAKAAALYAEAFADDQVMNAAPDVYLRGMEAYARLLGRNGETEKALALVDEGLRIAPQRPMFHDLRGRLEEGEVLKPLVPDAAQGVAETLYGLAMAINRRGAEPFVRRFLNLALHLAPGKDVYLYELARLDEVENRFAESITHFQAIPESSPLHSLAAMQAALNLSSLERDDEAKAQLQSLIAEEPGNLRAYLALGSIHARQKDFASVITLYTDALTANAGAGEDLWNIHYYRAIAYERSGQWDKAEPGFRKALELRPEQPQVLNYLGYSFIDRGENLEEALGMVERAVELAPDDGYIIDSLGWAFYKLGRYDEAVETLERAISLLPTDATINDHLGDAYWRVGRRIEARFQWNHALAGDPEPDLKQQILKKIEDGGLPDGDEASASGQASSSNQGG